MALKRGAIREPAPALVLFDIDGTLIRKAGGHHRDALVEAVRRVTGLESTTATVPVQGMLDRDILRVMLQNAGAGEELIRSAMPALVRRAEWIYGRSCPNLEDRVCPGVRELLGELVRRGIPAGLVTGNLSRIGWKKMVNAGLRPYFRFGAFAEQAADRAGLARMAIRIARERGWIDGNSRISLIGDHANDVLAAKANGIQAIAVATGLSPAAELATHSPDILLDDLRQLRIQVLVEQAA